MPTQLPSTCNLGAILGRTDARDALVMAPHLASSHKTLSSLPAGSIVGTSSVRRSAQIARLYPHLRFADVRGNIGTRLAKLDADPAESSTVGYSCLILAAAGIERLGLGGRITQYLESKTGGLLHAVGQGALGVEIRARDERVERLLEPLSDKGTTLACLAERSLMRTLEGGCSVPIGVETEWIDTRESLEGHKDTDGEGKGEQLLMRAVVVSLDGKDYVEGERRGEVQTPQQADEFGWAMAKELVEKGAGRILESINLNRDVIEKQDGA